MPLRINNVSPDIHIYGMSILKWCDADHRSYVYINIPKNATNWIKHNFHGTEFNYRTDTFHQPPEFFISEQTKDLWRQRKRFIVVLRDPYTRWISGLAQHLSGYEPDHPKFISNLNWNNVFDQVIFDNHTEPQVKFIEGIDPTKTVWFNCDSNLRYNFLLAWSRKFNDIPSPDSVNNKDLDFENMYNVTNKNLVKKNIAEQITNVLDNNPRWQQRIRDFYSEDYKLINSVEFYNSL